MLTDGIDGLDVANEAGSENWTGSSPAALRRQANPCRCQSILGLVPSHVVAQSTVCDLPRMREDRETTSHVPTYRVIWDESPKLREDRGNPRPETHGREPGGKPGPAHRVVTSLD